MKKKKYKSVVSLNAYNFTYTQANFKFFFINNSQMFMLLFGYIQIIRNMYNVLEYHKILYQQNGKTHVMALL